MKTQKLAGSVCTILLIALSAPSAFAQNASSASILFSRTNMRPIDNTSNTVLYRVKPSGVTAIPVTPSTIHVDYRGGSWSPGGLSIVYEQAPQSNGRQSQLFVVDRQGGPARQITTGPGLHTQASWGPGAAIAFVSNDNGQLCLGAVRADGTHQRILFCPPPRSDLRAGGNLSTPQWSLDGKSVYIEASVYGAGLESDWYSRVWRVNVATGAAVKITEQTFAGSDNLAIAPDGKHGFYPQAGTLVDFLTGTRTTVPMYGESARYSKDGCKIAITQEIPGSSPVVGYGAIFIMGADGSNVHPAIKVPDPAPFTRSAIGPMTARAFWSPSWLTYTSCKSSTWRPAWRRAWPAMESQAREPGINTKAKGADGKRFGSMGPLVPGAGIEPAHPCG